ncbi:hypothetical protein KDN32_17870 [Nocardioides sp. J2M5]|uniref:hypothetical protein n=1 Tax=Nocardioides palaemonis TaxID=2829810 RepID=UPI001BAD39E0|nr:hypothetical protein [Nocardioides palaemonis]MBS2939611.1 hypothetical protein [Nocardioides palaemonis]
MGDDAPLYLVDHVVEHDGDPRRWSGFTYDCPATGIRHVGTREASGTVHVDGRPAPGLSGAVGGYGEHLLVAQLLRDGEKTTSWLQLDESEPEAAPQRAELHREGVETTTLLDGATVQAERVRLSLDGAAANTHWIVDGVIVKSDWCGAQSFLVDDTGVLRAGLDHEVVEQIEDFAALQKDQPV